jgi:hypothetical protein
MFHFFSLEIILMAIVYDAPYLIKNYIDNGYTDNLFFSAQTRRKRTDLPLKLGV